MAVAREILATLSSNPLAISIENVFVATEDLNLVKSFETALGEKVSVIHGGPLSLNGQPEFYDAIVLSNVLDDWNLIKRKHHLGDLLKNILTTLKKNGTLVIRENMATHPISTIPDLTKFFDVFIAQDSTGNSLNFEFYTMKQVEDSLYAKNNHLDVYWVLTRAAIVQKYDEKLATFRDFLDKTQYTEDNVRSYEWIFGEHFISPGGAEENLKVLSNFGYLKPGGQMLDIGVGIGGGARQAATEYGQHVLGVDLSTNMIVHAFERNQRDKDNRVRYQICDATVFKFAANSFDYVFSRDCMQHIKTLPEVFPMIYKILKPGGKVLITLYGKGHGELKPKFLDYVAHRHYYLFNTEEIQSFAEKAGFVQIRTENLTQRFKEILLEEREHTVKNKEDFISRFSKELYDYMLEGWEDKLGYIADDNHNWNLIYAEKPI